MLSAAAQLPRAARELRDILDREWTRCLDCEGGEDRC